ncbi:MAG: helix-turn-helix domain-containing protein [Desulfarculaceae bacterium]|nr:helix-turn-helix domain-containing protein [Desulfarculaceae bacterium]MCF8074241.1 helix-turn-helix domain-containing protein [Desulfarculaceae bacterium]MCF8103000.1 helix-turn-helix domain-containing protein [Desulfarculaceae bacterium]MCF8117131.1 helix-turn-helix domain-containing protein [Desulfarculaceae bacterium]
MAAQSKRVGSGVGDLDKLLGGLYIGDNVVWQDDAGSLAWEFCHNFILASQAQQRPIIYVTFDRSPKNLLDKLGPLANYPGLTIMDCFTWGKGQGSDIFQRFYQEAEPPCQVEQMERPQDPAAVGEMLYALHAQLSGDVRFVFESLTGMAELWGGEEAILRFYGHACPRLYELETVAYWIMEKDAHSTRLKASIGQIAQVVIELSIKRGTTSLTVLKAENRPVESHHQPYNYWVRDHAVVFAEHRRATGLVELGPRLKELRGKKGLSQTELARLVGVTPSTISQVESNHIYPSLPALVKMAEVLGVEVASLFSEKPGQSPRLVFPAEDAAEVRLEDLPAGMVSAELLCPMDFDGDAEPYLIEVAAKASLPSHFFVHKGQEVGYLLSGKLQMKARRAVHSLKPGDVVYLTSDIPTQWSNPGRGPARLLWFKLR